MKNKDLKTKTVINERLQKIEEAVGQLKDIRKMAKKDFLKDSKSQYAAMFAMILGIEAICDIGNHILARYFNEPADTYKDVILKLGEVEVIPSQLANQSAEMTDFRNVLIHLYTKVDLEQVYENLQKAPEEFTKFGQYFLKFIES